MCINTLNEKVTALRNSMAWSNIRMHLIGAEDIDLNSFDFDLIARLWAATLGMQTKSPENKSYPMLEGGEGEEDWDFLAGSQSEGP